ncbi:hypothetical protein KIN20_036641 [Parelaphostrongylus tenuis]|uniref:Uncharacterized protein n=1 Tax=Parelaphostrongylus tenuis TaxID=148309 RepID=A0AAD5WLT8_PARTN|nr:hypothetical protein KIN20_036641 [Parelaphostrongylus tenuis]
MKGCWSKNRVKEKGAGKYAVLRFCDATVGADPRITEKLGKFKVRGIVSGGSQNATIRR